MNSRLEIGFLKKISDLCQIQIAEMKKTELLFEIIKQLITKPLSIRRIVDLNEYYDRYLLKKYGFNTLPTIELHQLFPEFNQFVEKYTYLEGNSLPIDIALLKSFAQTYQDCKYFEIGCWRGESLYNVAQTAHKCVSLSLSGEEMVQMGFDSRLPQQNHFLTAKLPNVEFHLHNSFTFDYSTLNDKFDLIFVDGDHHYKGVRIDSSNVVKLRKDDTSIIVWHDYGISPERPRAEVLAGILDGLPKELHPNLYHISNTLCAVLIMKEYKDLKPALFPTIPTKLFDIKIQVRPID